MRPLRCIRQHLALTEIVCSSKLKLDRCNVSKTVLAVELQEDGMNTITWKTLPYRYVYNYVYAYCVTDIPCGMNVHT